MKNINQTNEEWCPIKGYTGYLVSNQGRILGKRNKILKTPLHNGYPTVNLSERGKCKRQTVHRLVAEAFIPNPKNLPQVNHIDGDKTNNNVSNLEWCNAKHNIHHAYKTGLHSEKMLTEKETNEIRELYEEGLDMNLIADQYGVSYGTIKAKVAGIHRRQLSQKQKQRLIQLYENGEKIEQLSEMFGIDESTIYRHTKNTERNCDYHRKKKERDIITEKMKKLFDEGTPLDVIANKYNVSRACVYQRIRRFNRK